MDPALHLAPGSRLGDYILDAELGRGGSAVVYTAHVSEDSVGTVLQPNKRVAVKVQHLDQPETRKRFVREFETLRELRIPGVAEVYEAGEHDRLLWFSMEKVDGVDFRKKLLGIEDMRARVLAAAQLGIQLCDVLKSIHRHGYIHRDIKPSNVLVDGRNTIKVLDFGVVQGTASGTPITVPGSVLGTFPFMAPEQIAGLPMTEKLDIFAAGLLVYEGIVGPRPAPTKPHEWLSIQCLDRPTSLARLHQRIPRRISAVVDAMLRFNPEERPSAKQAMRMLIAALRKEGPAEWPSSPPFVNLGTTLHDLVSQVEGQGPRVSFLTARPGSGRKRMAEQVQRRAILRGIRSLKARSELHDPGGAVGSWLHQLLGRNPSHAWRDDICGEDGAVLAVMWPDLPVTWSLPDKRPSIQQVAEAAARVLCRAAEKQSLLLVVDNFDHPDSLTARTVDVLGQIAPSGLTLICIRDPRWEIDRCSRVVDHLCEFDRALNLRLPTLEPGESERLLRSLAPKCEAPIPTATTLRDANEKGLRRLAEWRKEPFPEVPHEVHVLGLANVPLPGSVLERLDLDPSELSRLGILRATPKGDYTLANERIREHCIALLDDRVAAEDQLSEAIAAAWVRDPRAHAEQARHLLHGSQPHRALVPAIDSTLQALAAGRMEDARKWLLVIDQLPRDTHNEAYQVRRFDLAIARAKVGMATQPRAPRADLVGQARRRARTPDQKARAKLLEAVLEARYGTGEIAIAQLNSLINQTTQTHVAVAALAEQGDLFLGRGEHARARAVVVRAEELRGTRKPDVMQSRLDRIRSDALAMAGLYTQAIQRCNAAMTLAEELYLDRAQARLKLRLAGIRLAMRQLDEAAELAWQSRAQHRGDRRLDFAIETTLVLAEIALLSANLTACRRLLAQAEAAFSDRPAPILRLRWLRLRLAQATARGDTDAARNVLSTAAELGETSPWWSITEARWWMDQARWDRAEALAKEVFDEHRHPIVLRVSAGRLLAALFLQGQRMERAREVARETRTMAMKAQLDVHGLAMELLIKAFDVSDDDGWSRLCDRAIRDRWTGLQLWAMELSAIRAHQQENIPLAKQAWKRLILRAQLLGHQGLRRRAMANLRALSISAIQTGPDAPTQT